MLTWLADCLRGAGLTVREVPGWTTRGHGDMGQVLGVLCHHTGGPATGDGRLGTLTVPGYPSLAVVVNGRTDLPGPLCNVGLARDGAWVVVAAGQAWHAGTGAYAWCPANTGNTHLVGVEAESNGSGTDWTAAQIASYPRGVAALLAHEGLPASRAIAHREWATPPGRKVDPAGIDMNAFRTAVARLMGTPTPTPTTTEDPLMALTEAEQRDILEAARSVLFGIAGKRSAGPTALAIDGIRQDVSALRQELAGLHQANGLDPAAIARQVADAVIAAGVAGPVADELARRLSA